MIEQPELGQRLAELRKNKGFTQEEVAVRSGVNVRTIQRIETGGVKPRTFTVKTILNSLGYKDTEYPTTIFPIDQNQKTAFNTSKFHLITNYILKNMDTFKNFSSNYFIANGIIWTLCGICILLFKWNFGPQEISITLLLPLSYALFRVFEKPKTNLTSGSK